MTVSDRDRGDPTPSYRALLHAGLAPLTVGLVMLILLDAFELIGAATAMPAALDDLGNVGFYGWAIAAPLIASLMGAPYGGRLADRFGVRRPMVLALGLMAIGLLGASAATSMVMLAAVRFVVGLGIGAMTTMMLVIVARRYPTGLRPRMLTLVSAAFILPGLIGPAVAAAMAQTIGWRWVFGGILPLLVLTGLLILPALDGDAPSATTVTDNPAVRPSWWGPLALSGGLVAVVGGLSNGGLRLVPIGLVGLVLAVIGFRSTLPRGVLRPVRGPGAAVTGALYMSLAYLTFEAFLPLVLNQVRHQSLFRSGLPLTVAALAWTAGSWLQAHLAASHRPMLAVSGGLLTAAGLALATSLLWDVSPYWIAYPATGLGAFGMGLAFTIDQVVAVEWAEAGREGEASANVNLANLLGGAAGTAMTAIALAWFDTDIRVAVAISLAVMIAAALAGAHAGRFLPDHDSA